jgi:NCS1 family nucleobase:cation symporter-1
MIADYFFIRAKELNLEHLYKEQGEYTFNKGFNTAAIIALVLGIVPNVPGFLVKTNLMAETTVWPWVSHLYNYAWFVGFIVSGFVYWLLMKPKNKI